MHPLDALGNPVRRAILVALRAQPLSVVEIAERFPVSRPAISRHLAILAQAGLVELHEEGARNLYAVRMAGFGSVHAFLDDFWSNALGRMERLAHKKKSGR